MRFSFCARSPRLATDPCDRFFARRLITARVRSEWARLKGLLAGVFPSGIVLPGFLVSYLLGSFLSGGMFVS